jgi:hypothetical protein
MAMLVRQGGRDVAEGAARAAADAKQEAESRSAQAWLKRKADELEKFDRLKDELKKPDGNFLP